VLLLPPLLLVTASYQPWYYLYLYTVALTPTCDWSAGAAAVLVDALLDLNDSRDPKRSAQ
jgi:hypothetical protein